MQVLRDLWGSGKSDLKATSSHERLPASAGRRRCRWLSAPGRATREWNSPPKYAGLNFCFGKGVNTLPPSPLPPRRMKEAADKTGRNVGLLHVLFMVIADETDDAARAPNGSGIRTALTTKR
ncbi:hypothetical protein ACNKHS_06015 [Shigella flexneri]